MIGGPLVVIVPCDRVGMYLFIYSSTNLSIHLCIYLAIYLPTYVSIYLCIHLSAYLSIFTISCAVWRSNFLLQFVRQSTELIQVFEHEGCIEEDRDEQKNRRTELPRRKRSKSSWQKRITQNRYDAQTAKERHKQKQE